MVYKPTYIWGAPSCRDMNGKAGIFRNYQLLSYEDDEAPSRTRVKSCRDSAAEFDGSW